MRDELEMIRLITDTAKADERIRACYIEGSRVNPKVKKDRFQDYDIAYVVRETRSFIEDSDWIRRFGDIMYMQYPDNSPYYPSDTENSYGWLMQFEDGVRLDLTVKTEEQAKKTMDMYEVLIDKDGIFEEQNQLSDMMFWIEEPNQEKFDSTTNEFWWCLNNVAKGLWRAELPYVMDMINFIIRPMLVRVIEWDIAYDHNFEISIGKNAKFMKDYADPYDYERYLATYSQAQTKDIWDATFRMCDLFDEISKKLAGKMGFIYREMEARKSREYLENVSQMKGPFGI